MKAIGKINKLTGTINNEQKEMIIVKCPPIVCEGETLHVTDSTGKEYRFPLVVAHMHIEDGNEKGSIRLVVHFETKQGAKQQIKANTRKERSKPF